MHASFESMTAVGRFAPSTTGPPHPGTLLAALLCWLDIRSRRGQLLLRLEDLDPDRAKPHFSEEMLRALEWLGLDWDGLERQSENLRRYSEALDSLAAAGRLYPCSCSRRGIREAGGTTTDGTPRYPGTCRERSLPSDGWRSSADPLRLRCDPPETPARDEDGTPLLGEWAGDPLLRRRDGAFGYHLVSVVDDAARGVTRVVRGRDLAASTAPQCALQGLLESSAARLPPSSPAPGASGAQAREASRLAQLGGTAGEPRFGAGGGSIGGLGRPASRSQSDSRDGAGGGFCLGIGQRGRSPGELGCGSAGLAPGAVSVRFGMSTHITR